MPNLAKIIRGDDITDHYLAKDQNEFKIFRYEKNVYAVRYNKDTQEPISFVHMWRSHKSEDIEKTSEVLGKGVEGIVREKTPDKVVKQEIFKRPKNRKDPNINTDKNIEILKHKFLLSEHHIEKYFIFGLWSTKGESKDFFMPRVTKKDYSKEDYPEAFNEFILALKRANELGLSHPDYSNDPFHKSFQNEIFTEDGIKLIDLDKGLSDHKKEDANSKYRVYGRDQWLYVYNYKFNKGGTDTGWRQKINDWYKENPGKALSENPEILLKFSPPLALPKSVVKELEMSKKYDILLDSAGSEEQFDKFRNLKQEALGKIKEKSETSDPKSYYEMIDRESKQVDDLITGEAKRYTGIITSLKEAFPEKPPKNFFFKWLDRIFGAEESIEKERRILHDINSNLNKINTRLNESHLPTRNEIKELQTQLKELKEAALVRHEQQIFNLFARLGITKSTTSEKAKDFLDFFNKEFPLLNSIVELEEKTVPSESVFQYTESTPSPPISPRVPSASKDNDTLTHTRNPDLEHSEKLAKWKTTRSPTTSSRVLTKSDNLVSQETTEQNSRKSTVQIHRETLHKLRRTKQKSEETVEETIQLKSGR